MKRIIMLSVALLLIIGSLSASVGGLPTQRLVVSGFVNEWAPIIPYPKPWDMVVAPNYTIPSHGTVHVRLLNAADAQLGNEVGVGLSNGLYCFPESRFQGVNFADVRRIEILVNRGLGGILRRTLHVNPYVGNYIANFTVDNPSSND
jgi:hypothetical protein